MPLSKPEVFAREVLLGVEPGFQFADAESTEPSRAYADATMRADPHCFITLRGNEILCAADFRGRGVADDGYRVVFRRRTSVPRGDGSRTREPVPKAERYAVETYAQVDRDRLSPADLAREGDACSAAGGRPKPLGPRGREPTRLLCEFNTSEFFPEGASPAAVGAALGRQIAAARAWVRRLQA